MEAVDKNCYNCFNFKATIPLIGGGLGARLDWVNTTARCKAGFLTVGDRDRIFKNVMSRKKPLLIYGEAERCGFYDEA